MDRIWNVWVVGQDVRNLIFAAPREPRGTAGVIARSVGFAHAPNWSVHPDVLLAAMIVQWQTADPGLARGIIRRMPRPMAIALPPEPGTHKRDVGGTTPCQDISRLLRGSLSPPAYRREKMCLTSVRSAIASD
jgi:hypothetical protein